MPGQFEQLLVARDENARAATCRQFQEFLIILVAAAGEWWWRISCGLAHYDETEIGLHQVPLVFVVKREFGICRNTFKFGEASCVAKAANAAPGDGVFQPICPGVMEMKHVHDDIGIQDDPDRGDRCLW